MNVDDTVWFCKVFDFSIRFAIQVMENLASLVNLQELWLGRNRIKAVNLCGLQCIKKLSLQSNRLTSMTGLEVILLPTIIIFNVGLGEHAFSNFNQVKL